MPSFVSTVILVPVLCVVPAANVAPASKGGTVSSSICGRGGHWL